VSRFHRQGNSSQDVDPIDRLWDSVRGCLWRGRRNDRTRDARQDSTLPGVGKKRLGVSGRGDRWDLCLPNDGVERRNVLGQHLIERRELFVDTLGEVVVELDHLVSWRGV